MELVVGPGGFSGDRCELDLSVVDQILSNLVDNAVKYAGSAQRPAHSSGRRTGGAMADDSPFATMVLACTRRWSAGCSGRSQSRPMMPRNRRRESVWVSP